ncbi:MAG: isopentenyl phosphate kinase [Patescibacteria group bacterium]
MGNISIVKLGGSIITDKKGRRPLLRIRRIREIAREVARIRSKDPNLHLILLHGAGSFGHPLAYRYKLMGQPLSKETLVGVGYTTSAVRELGNLLSKAFLDAGVPVVPLQTSSFTCMRRGRLHFNDLSVLRIILKNGGIPLLGGDVVFSEFGKTAIASADGLAVALAKKFKPARLFFASDTNGVYATFPPRVGEWPLSSMDRAAVRNLLRTQRVRATPTDVTGAMLGKLRALLDMRGTTVTIFNGNVRGAVAGVLSRKKRGTEIVL